MLPEDRRSRPRRHVWWSDATVADRSSQGLWMLVSTSPSRRSISPSTRTSKASTPARSRADVRDLGERTDRWHADAGRVRCRDFNGNRLPPAAALRARSASGRTRTSGRLWTATHAWGHASERAVAVDADQRSGRLRQLHPRACGEGWVLVGDAGQFKDPIFGQGIGDAVRSAESLADCLLEASRRDPTVASSREVPGHARPRSRAELPVDDPRKPVGLSKGEFDSIMESLGSDPQQAERFINVFSHAVSGSEFFGRVNASDLLGRSPPRSTGVSCSSGTDQRGHPAMSVEDRINELGYHLGELSAVTRAIRPMRRYRRIRIHRRSRALR